MVRSFRVAWAGIVIEKTRMCNEKCGHSATGPRAFPLEFYLLKH